jgi:hypothetical protein
MNSRHSFTIITIAISLLFNGCLFDPQENQDSSPRKLFVFESDFQSGYLEWFGTDSLSIVSNGIPIYSDAVIKAQNGFIYILERMGADNIIKFDPSKSDVSGIIYQEKLTAKGNPQDIVILNDTKGYVANQDIPFISIINPATGKTIQNIDIKAYTFRPDSNTTPYACDMELVGSDLYVLLQRRHTYNPGAPSLIIKINTTTDAITDTIALQYKNANSMTYANGFLYVSTPGSAFVTGDGAIESVNLSTKQVQTVIDETALGGNPNQIIYKTGTRLYVQNYIGWQNVAIQEIDASTGAVIAKLPNIIDAFGGMYYDSIDNRLYVGERATTELGVKIFQNNILVGSPIKSSKSLPPSSMVVVR